MGEHEVLISGMGVVSAAGNGLPETLDGFARGLRNAGRVSLFASPLECPVFECRIPRNAGADKVRTVRLAMLAVAEALADARLPSLAGLRVGVCFGTTVASQLNDIEFYATLRGTNSTSLEPVDRFLKGNLADVVASRYGADGPRLTIVNACSSGSDAIGVAFSWINRGLCDVAIAGGADELNRVPMCGFHALGVMSKELCAPFDRNRSGLNLGEGAGVIVLEKGGTAWQRGLTPRLRLAGYGSASDAYHPTAPRPDGAGLEGAIRAALAEAGIGPADISFINAHGTATRENDKVEGKLFAKVFGESVPFLSTKGYTGHTLGAAGGLEAAFTAAGLREGWIPANAGFCEKDDEIGAVPVRERTAVRGRYAMSTSLAFGGINTALVIARGEAAA